MPTQNNKKNSFFEKYKNNFLIPSEKEITKNSASRSAKLRYATRTEQLFYYPKEFKDKFFRQVYRLALADAKLEVFGKADLYGI